VSLLTVRNRFMLMNGLVTGSFTTAEMNQWINEGQRYLDERQDHPYVHTSQVGSLFPNQATIEISGLRVLEEVRIHGEEGGIKLQKVDLAALMEKYELFQPPRYGADLVTNGRFDGAATGWTLNTGWTYDDDRVEHTTGNTGTLTRLITGEAGTYRVSIKVDDMTAGSVTVSIGGTTSLVVSANGIHSTVIEATSAVTAITVTPSTDFDGAVDSVAVNEQIDPGVIEAGTPKFYALNRGISLAPSQAAFDLSDLAQMGGFQDIIIANIYTTRGIVVYPPPSQVFSFRVTGKFFSPALSADGDTSYWTEERPETLAKAASLKYMEYFSNFSRTQQIVASIDLDMVGMDRDLAAEDVVDIHNMGG
jgi:hypothetical protein